MSTLTDASDEELISAIARGDEEAFTCLYDRYCSILFGFLFRILRNYAEAEDVLQLVFVEVWRHGADFDVSRGRPFTWLIKRAQSRAIDRVRSHRRTTASAHVFPERHQAVSEIAMGTEQRSLVKAALASLSDEQRQVLVLAYFEGLTQTEMSAFLGIPLGTVKTRVREGLGEMRKVLKTSVQKANPGHIASCQLVEVE